MPTNDDARELRLSLEEVAVLLNLLGHTQLAGETLRAQTGDIPPDEARGRLLAANRSLAARGVLQLDGDQLRIDPAHAHLLAPLADNRFVLRCAVREPGRSEQALVFYVRDDLVVEQRIEHSVAHSFRPLAGRPDAAVECLVFLGLTDLKPFTAAPFGLTAAQFDEARALAAAGAAQAESYLRERGVDDATIPLFVDDLAHQRRRGAVVRLEIDTVGGSIRDDGFLALVGQSGRAWLLIAENGADGPALRVRAADADWVRQSVEAAFALLAVN